MQTFIDEEVNLPEHVSYSQITTWLLCGYQYFLIRVKHEPEEPSVWSVGGRAFHKATEKWDLEQVNA